MKKGKSTKRALLTSVLSLMLCVAMLIGSTFAWFTDTASTNVNRIQSGKLDVTLEMKDAEGNWVNAEGETLAWKTADNRSTAVLWEPGCTYELPAVRVKNNGNLALKFKIIISGIVGDAELLEAIDFTYGALDVNAEGTLLAGDTSDAITITGHMKEEAGNEYMDKSIEGIAITVVATQVAHEFDSNGNDYDEGLEYPVLPAVITKTISEVVDRENDTVLESAGVTATIPVNALPETVTNVTLRVETEECNVNSATYEISLVDQNGNPVESSGDPITVTLPIGSGLKNVKVNHSGVPMDSDDYSYNSVTGILTIETTHFSPFEVTFEQKGSVWIGDIDTEGLTENTNTTEKTVTIGTPEQFAAFAKNVNSGNTYKGYTITLTSDINLGNVAWTPIGDGKTTFRGTFDGKEKTIKNITVTESKKEAGTSNEYAGLFGKVADAMIKNVTLENVTVTASLNAGNFTVIGAVAGQAFTGTVENVIVKNFNVTNAATAKYVGGITGHGYAAIKNCYVQAGINPKVAAQVGGVIGMQAGKATIESCYVDVDIDGGFTIAGGIIGFANSGEGARNIKNCYVTGNIKANSSYPNYSTKSGNAAGIAGYGYSTTATNCYCDATVTQNQMLLANCAGDYGTAEMYSIVDCSWTGDFDSYIYYGYQNKENGNVYEEVTRSKNCTYSAGMSYEEFLAATPAN